MSVRGLRNKNNHSLVQPPLQPFENCARPATAASSPQIAELMAPGAFPSDGQAKPRPITAF